MSAPDISEFQAGRNTPLKSSSPPGSYIPSISRPEQHLPQINGSDQQNSDLLAHAAHIRGAIELLKSQHRVIISSFGSTNNQQQYSLGISRAHEYPSLQTHDPARHHLNPGPGARSPVIPPLYNTPFLPHITPQQHCATRTLPAPTLDTGFLMGSHRQIYSQPHFTTASHCHLLFPGHHPCGRTPQWPFLPPQYWLS